MGYRGEDVPTARGDWGHQTPWQPTPGNTAGWDGRPQGYQDGENYPPADDGHGYPADGGYPGQGQGYPPSDGQYGNAYQPQQPYEQYDGYGPGQGQPGADGYGGTGGYPQRDDYGYEYGQNPPSGYGQAGYDQRPAPGYPPADGYQDPNGGYGQPPGYAAPPAGSGGYPALPAGGTGGYSADDAGNDWYGGQPAAANGASFADTGTYRLNGRVIDEYGTGPREALNDPALGYPPGPGNPAASGPQPFQRTGPQGLAETRQQQRLDEQAYQAFGQDAAPGRPGRSAGDQAGGYGTGDQAAYGTGAQAAYGTGDQGAYGTADAYAAPGYGGYNGPAQPGNQAGDGYNDYSDGFNGDEQDDPYLQRYGDDTDPRAGGGGRGRNAPGGRTASGGLRGKRLLFAAVGVVAVGVIGVAAYAFLFKSNSPSGPSSAQGPLPTGTAQASQQACAKTLGTYCHIEASTDDPKALTPGELYPPAFTNEQDKTSYSLVSTKTDTKCSNAVIGTTLISALNSGKCTQVVRASYVSGDNKIMGTIGVVNLSTTNQSHHAGKDVGQNDFIAPLTSKKGVASKLGNGTGVVESEFKGHYLILTWSEFVNGTDPKTKTQQNQLMRFSNDLVGETANIALSQRMVTGAPASPAAASS